jgi:protein-S-isoprenylcysteine O-methyltransferase Ste14
MSQAFFERGGWWVIVQTLLMLALGATAPMTRGHWEGRWSLALGWLLFGVGAVFGVAGLAVLRLSRTVFPKPLDGAELVQRGIYRIVRHPLYTSATLLAFSWTLFWQSLPALLVAAALGVFFNFKARREERWLEGKFPEYVEYQRRVKRLIPWLY